jgi:hypothetical protein
MQVGDEGKKLVVGRPKGVIHYNNEHQPWLMNNQTIKWLPLYQYRPCSAAGFVNG